MKTFIVSFALVSSAALPAFAETVFSEKDGNAAPLVNLPNFAPIIEQLDKTIVNVSGTIDPAKHQAPGRGRRGTPNDPFSDPDEFFERFFGQPFREMPQQQRKTLGSGFIISKDGYIMTNNHVVEDSDKIEITILSTNNRDKKGNTFQATLVGRDPATDVALLKIKADRPLSFAYLGNSTKIQKGDWVLAFGNPFGLDHSVSAGIISAIGREISPNENRRFDDFIQTDAAINFGNSGGPLVNLRGEVIGINTAITAQGSGIGFAVPVNIAKDVVSQLKDKGSVTRGYLGIMIQDVSDEMKDALGVGDAKGVLVNDLVADGPAEKSGIQRGDVILKINGTEIPDSKTLQKTVALVRPGGTVEVELIRDKKNKKISVKVGSLGEDQKKKPKEQDAPKYDKLGLAVGLAEDGKSIEVKSVSDDGVAVQFGVMDGDIIRGINKQPVSSLSQYEKIVGGLKSGSNVFLDLERGNVKTFLAFRMP